MNLDETQRKKVAAWVAEGLKLSEIQNRMASELGQTLTYMDVRLLVDDLKLVPKDVELPKSTAGSSLATASAVPKPGTVSGQTTDVSSESAPAGGGVSITVDQLARPGAIVSGKVVFSDGNRADWYLDQTGRLGLSPQQAGYRPPAADLQQFQIALENELSKLGF